MEQLALWLYGMKVALVWQARGRLRLQYTDEVQEKYNPGVPVLSLGLPLRPEHYTHAPARAFLDGLLPEGSPREAIANRMGIKPDDTYGLIKALGRDCAGAIVIQPDEDSEPKRATVLSGQPLTPAELAKAIAELPDTPLGVEGSVRLSLAGVQDKLVLTRLPSGQWARPIDGTPSTHLLKPSIDRFPGIVDNEAFCMRLAGHLGLPVAKVEVAEIEGHRLLVVERFDRRVHEDGSLDRIHQEDFCQAFLRLPGEKYEDKGGPPLRAIAEILQVATPPTTLEMLLSAVTLNLLIGNCDAHAKNFSLVHEESGAMRLAPLYDLVSTLSYPALDKHLAMFIDHLQRIDRVTFSRVVNEAASWGMSPGAAGAIVRDLLERTPEAIEAAQAETPAIGEALPDLVRRQLRQIDSD